MKLGITLLLFVLIIGLNQSCKKDNVYPIEPEIEMSPRQVYQSPTIIIVSFTDGDGDIGFNDGDTLPPYNLDEENFNKFYYNLLLYYFIKEGDEWLEVELAVPYYYRVPYITPSGQNKSLKGEIEVEITLPINRPDSIRFDIELIDRALHESNRLTTPVIYR